MEKLIKTSGVTGLPLAAGEYAEIQIRVTKINWTNYTQTDVYSFEGTAMNYVDSPKVTGYITA